MVIYITIGFLEAKVHAIIHFYNKGVAALSVSGLLGLIMRTTMPSSAPTHPRTTPPDKAAKPSSISVSCTGSRVVEWVIELVSIDQRELVQELVHEIVQERVRHSVDDPNIQVTPST